MSAFDLHSDLALRLDRLVPAEALAGDWADVVRRTRREPRRRRRAFKLAVGTALFLVLAAVATATYVALTRSGSGPLPGALTVINGGPAGAAQIVEVRPGGKARVLWHCPENVFCGELVGVDWSPDARHVAFTLDELGGASAYVGLHIVDVATDRDIHIPHVPLAYPMAPQPRAVFERLLRQSDQRLGCRWPHSVAWSPDGTRLAYDCGDSGHRAIFTIRSDGTGHLRLPARLPNVSGPAWSPDGSRIAFAGSTTNGPSSIYVMRLDGSKRVLVARHGTDPDWSPDGRTIAYRHHRGIALVNAGRHRREALQADRDQRGAGVGARRGHDRGWNPRGRLPRGEVGR
jgi:dipeptidyl aminopeptidase/acylaminoacyl peptidase